MSDSDQPYGHPDPGYAPAPVPDTRAEGLRRLSRLTVAAAVAAAAATGVVAMAAHHASNPATDPATSVSVGSDDSTGGDQLQAPTEAPRRADRAPAGVSSGS